MAGNRDLGRGPSNITSSGSLEMIGTTTLISERFQLTLVFTHGQLFWIVSVPWLVYKLWAYSYGASAPLRSGKICVASCIKPAGGLWYCSLLKWSKYTTLSHLFGWFSFVQMGDKNKPIGMCPNQQQRYV